MGEVYPVLINLLLIMHIFKFGTIKSMLINLSFSTKCSPAPSLACFKGCCFVFQILQHSRKKTRERGRKDAPGNWIPSDKHWFYKVTWQRVSCMPSTHYLPQDIKQIQFYFLFALTTPRTVSLECFRDCQILLLKSRQQSSVQYMFI